MTDIKAVSMKTISELGDLRGKRVLVRCDFNVPIKDGAVLEPYRIEKALPTIRFLKDQGAKSILVSHIEGDNPTLVPIYEYLKNVSGLELNFCVDCLEEGTTHSHAMKNGDIMLCENLRLYDGEKRNDPVFAKQLAALGDVFINDAFSVSHRKHASVVGVPGFLPSGIGFQFEEEVKHLSQMFAPQHPFVFVLGGAKFETKLPLVEKFSELADTAFVGGALSNDLYKRKGFETGKSLLSKVAVDLSRVEHNSRVMIPEDVVAMSVDGHRVCLPNEVRADETIVDSGPATVVALAEKLAAAKMILWNGPLGNYELGFTEQTYELTRHIAAATKRGAITVIGGGDTLASIATLGLQDSFTFVSTGGGAMLDFLANETLPGIEAIKKSKR
jgi:phosphoglycerate kinase